MLNFNNPFFIDVFLFLLTKLLLLSLKVKEKTFQVFVSEIRTSKKKLKFKAFDSKSYNLFEGYVVLLSSFYIPKPESENTET